RAGIRRGIVALQDLGDVEQVFGAQHLDAAQVQAGVRATGDGLVRRGRAGGAPAGQVLADHVAVARRTALGRNLLRAGRDRGADARPRRAGHAAGARPTAPGREPGNAGTADRTPDSPRATGARRRTAGMLDQATIGHPAFTALAAGSPGAATATAAGAAAAARATASAQQPRAAVGLEAEAG